ncbi:hypothetical protein T231_13610 [Tannerella sp. oral taxon BU063 isolate Cell 6/7/9]|uniref:Uncharacterized protein n=1 Tax=Tannerella sp. oral taxon BU063 isolate Cell 6/7/9 TaxID=1411021 RepID=W2CPB8_9BACT|nr:hypothetical protein T231_13610 [Tannerella sp. oral taxon BU063 isolate Cell 6/7/9]
MCFPLKEEREEGEGGINISSRSGTGDFEGLLRIEVDQEDGYLCRWMPHKTLSTTGETENTERQGCEKKRRQTFSTFCLDFGWIRGGWNWGPTTGGLD